MHHLDCIVPMVKLLGTTKFWADGQQHRCAAQPTLHAAVRSCAESEHADDSECVGVLRCCVEVKEHWQMHGVNSWRSLW